MVRLQVQQSEEPECPQGDEEGVEGVVSNAVGRDKVCDVGSADLSLGRSSELDAGDSAERGSVVEDAFDCGVGKAEVRNRRSEIRNRRSEIRNQRSEIRSQKSEIRDQRSEHSAH